MINYQVYKLVHLFGIFLTLISLGGMYLHAMNGGTKETNASRKLSAIGHGVGLFLVLLGGFGMLARALGHDLTVPDIFKQARNNVPWAEAIFDASARGVAALCADIKLMLDPARIVIGGGIGLVPFYLDRVMSHLKGLRLTLRPGLCPAALGANAGVLGIAALHNAQTP